MELVMALSRSDSTVAKRMACAAETADTNTKMATKTLAN